MQTPHFTLLVLDTDDSLDYSALVGAIVGGVISGLVSTQCVLLYFAGVCVNGSNPRGELSTQLRDIWVGI